MPFICTRRTDIPNNILQLIELRPNTSQRNLILDPSGQTKYLRQVQNDTVFTAAPGAIITIGVLKGLAVYLIDNVEDTPNGDALTAAQANTIAGAILTAMQAGTASTQTNVDVLIAATVAGSGLTTGNSTGSINDVLRILAGDEYVVPAGSTVDDDGSTFTTAVAGAFTVGVYRNTILTGALRVSVAEGRLSQLVAATYEYLGVAGAAVVVYDDTGAVFTSP